MGNSSALIGEVRLKNDLLNFALSPNHLRQPSLLQLPRPENWQTPRLRDFPFKWEVKILLSHPTITEGYSILLLAQHTENLAEILTSILRDLSNNPASAATVDNIIKDNYNPCLTSLEGSLQSVETAVTLVKTTGPEIEVLTDKFNSFTKLKDPAIIVRETGAM